MDECHADYSIASRVEAQDLVSSRMITQLAIIAHIHSLRHSKHVACCRIGISANTRFDSGPVAVSRSNQISSRHTRLSAGVATYPDATVPQIHSLRR